MTRNPIPTLNLIHQTLLSLGGVVSCAPPTKKTMQKGLTAKDLLRLGNDGVSPHLLLVTFHVRFTGSIAYI
jgi:hypothetical protein